MVLHESLHELAFRVGLLVGDAAPRVRLAVHDVLHLLVQHRVQRPVLDVGVGVGLDLAPAAVVPREALVLAELGVAVSFRAALDAVWVLDLRVGMCLARTRPASGLRHVLQAASHLDAPQREAHLRRELVVVDARAGHRVSLRDSERLDVLFHLLLRVREDPHAIAVLFAHVPRIAVRRRSTWPEPGLPRGR